jgi:hypothetical protein
MKIAVGDVVRVKKDGVVGTVVGFANHAAMGGYQVAVAVGHGRDRTVPAGDLEFVAHGKPTPGNIKAVAIILALMLSVGVGVWLGVAHRGYGVPVFPAVCVGFLYGMGVMEFLSRRILRKRKVKVS